LFKDLAFFLRLDHLEDFGFGGEGVRFGGVCSGVETVLKVMVLKGNSTDSISGVSIRSSLRDMLVCTELVLPQTTVIP